MSWSYDSHLYPEGGTSGADSEPLELDHAKARIKKL